MNRGVYLKTFGCQMNEHDSERMMGILTDMGYIPVQTLEQAELALLNTCSIREKADQKAYSDLGRIEKLKRKNPSLIVAVGGCMAKQEGSRIFDRVPSVNLIFNSKNIWKLPLLIEAAGKGQKRLMALEDSSSTTPYSAKRKGNIKAWVSIMEGCDKSCTYCIVPFTRGREISRPFEEIILEVKNLGATGYKEITLLGQNVNSYGKNGVEGMDFPGLLKGINEIEGIERIRFTTSHPWDLSPKLIDAMASLSKVCEHLHLPLQSGSNRVLKRMQRDYTVEEYKEKVGRLRKTVPNLSLTTDIIVGFPGEEQTDFEITLEAVQEIGFDGIFAFKYSHRPNTPANSMEGKVPEEVKDHRLQSLLGIQKTITDRKHQTYLNKIEEILVEGPSKMNKEILLNGRTRTNKSVNFPGDPSWIGQLIQLRITKIKANSFEGMVAVQV